MSWQELLGFIGGALTTGSLVPQVWRLFRLRSAREISLPFTSFLVLGVVCWLAYGIVMDLPPLIVWNTITLVFAIAMFYAKMKYGK